MANRIIGLKNLHIAPLNNNGRYGTPIKLVGAKTLNTTNEFSESSFYSDDILDYYNKGLTSMEVEIELAYLTPEIESLLTGKQFDEATGALVSGSTDTSATVALLYEMTTLNEPIRRVIYEVVLTKEETNAATKTDSVEEQLVKLVGKAKPREVDNKFDLVLDKNNAAVKETAWNTFFDGVLLPRFSNKSKTK